MFEMSYVDVVGSCRVVVSGLFDGIFCVFCCDSHICVGKCFGCSVCDSVVCMCFVCYCVCELFVEFLCFLFVGMSCDCVEGDGGVLWL